MMPNSAFYPYRSPEARDRCFAYFDKLAAKRWPVVSHEQMVETSYGPTFVRATGPASAPPLILLHGLGATSLMWSPNVGALSAGFRTYAVDQIGEFGKSICTKPARNMADLVAWLDSLMDGLELTGGVNIIGMSYGGALAAQYALNCPARVGRVVLLAPGNTVLWCGVQFWVRLMFALISRRTGVPAFMRWVFPYLAQRDPAWIDSIVEEFDLNSTGIERHKPVMPPVLTDAEWGSMAPPALFLVGDHDVIYSPERAVARLRRVAPNVTAEIVGNAGHDFTFVQAGAVNRRILEFLRKPAMNAASAAAR
jgi:pimeloyl-ACP methyl ester carboxylesterase